MINRKRIEKQEEDPKKGGSNMAKVGRPKGTTRANGYKVSSGRPRKKKSYRLPKVLFKIPKRWGDWVK